MCRVAPWTAVRGNQPSTCATDAALPARDVERLPCECCSHHNPRPGMAETATCSTSDGARPHCGVECYSSILLKKMRNHATPVRIGGPALPTCSVNPRHKVISSPSVYYALSPKDVWWSKGTAPCIHRHWTEVGCQLYTPVALWPELEAQCP